MKILITGVTGFVGSHFVDYLLAKHPEVEIHGTVLPKKEHRVFIKKYPFVQYHECDLNDKAVVGELIATIKPERIFHLAAQSYVSSSWENPELTLQTNIIGQSNLLEAVRLIRDEQYDPVVVVIGSSEEYGPSTDDPTPIVETKELRPQSPYAISKIGQDFMGYQYAKAYGMNIVRLRSFNHTGPRRASVFGVSNFARKIAEIEKGLRPAELEIRDLSAIRDFTDVRDVVRAYWLAAQKCQAGEVYNVCSSRGVSFETILNQLLSFATVKNIALVKDQAGPRPTDGGVIVGDNTKFKTATGWEVEIDFLQTTLFDMLNYWRENL